MVPVTQIPEKWRSKEFSNDRYVGRNTHLSTTEEKRAARSLLASKKNKLDPQQVEEVIKTGNGDLLRYVAERTDLSPKHWDLMAKVLPLAAFHGTYSTRSKNELELKNKVLSNMDQKQLLKLAMDKPNDNERYYGNTNIRGTAANKLDATHLMSLYDPSKATDPELLKDAIKNNPNFGREHLELALQYPDPKVGHAAVHSRLFDRSDFNRYAPILRGEAKAALYKRAFNDWGMATPGNINAVLNDPDPGVRKEPIHVLPVENADIRNFLIQNHIDKPEIAKKILDMDGQWSRRERPSYLSDDDIKHIIDTHGANKDVMDNIDENKHLHSQELAEYALKNALLNNDVRHHILASGNVGPFALHDYINQFDTNSHTGYDAGAHIRDLSYILNNPNTEHSHLKAIQNKLAEHRPSGEHSYEARAKIDAIDDVKARLAAHPAASGDILQSVNLNDQGVLAKLAGRGGKLSPEMHEAISSSASAIIRENYAMYHYSSMPPEIQAKMLKDSSAKVRARMASKLLKLPTAQIPQDAIKAMMTDSSSRIREDVFSKQDLPQELLEWAAKSSKSGTRLLAVKHKDATPEMINAAAYDKSEHVRQAAAYTGKLGDEQAAHVFSKADKDRQERLLRHSRFKLPDNAVDMVIDRGNQSAMRQLATKDEITSDQLRKIYNSGDEDVKAKVSEHKNTPVDVLEQAIYHPDKTVASLALRNGNLPTQVAHSMANTSDPSLMHALVSRHDADENIFQKALSLNNSDVEEGMLNNNNLPSRYVTELYRKGHERRAINHPGISDELLIEASEHENEYIRRNAKEKMKLHNPDLYNQTLEGGHDVYVNPITEKLKNLKGIVEQLPGGSVHKKEMEKLGHQNLPNQILDSKGHITPASIDAHEDSLPKERYNISYSKWDSMQRHDNSVPQKVVQVNLTNEHVKKLREAGLWDTFKKVHDMSFRSGHPVEQHTLGWARIDDSHPGHWHIDEIQSDLGRGTIQAIEGARTRGEMSDSEADMYSSHLKQMIKLLAGGHKTINHAIFSAVHAIGRKRGITSTSMDTLPDQMKQSGQSMDKAPPVHMKETYEELPKQMGFKNTPKKDTMPNTKAPEAELQVRKLVKSLQTLYKSMASLKEVTSGRHSKSGASKQEATPATGKKKVHEKRHIRADTQSHLDYKDENGKSLAYKEELEKGSAQRLFPFDPLSVPEKERKPVEEWTEGNSSTRLNIPRLEGPARARGLMKLHSQTQVRRNPQTGEREFLLHRGKTSRDVFAGLGGDDKGLSSFSPDKKIALDFNQDAVSDLSQDFSIWAGDIPALQQLKHEHKNLPKELRGDWARKNFGHIYSAWVPESAIHHIPNTIGGLIYSNNGKFSNTIPKRSRRSKEKEIIVDTRKVPKIDEIPSDRQQLLSEANSKVKNNLKKTYDVIEDLEKSDPSEKIRNIATQYAKTKGINFQHGSTPTKVNPEFAAKVANAYHVVKHTPDHPEVKQSYNALIGETLSQFNHMKKNGFKFSRIEPGMEPPYKNSADLHRDANENNHLWYYPTDAGFGSNPKHKTNDHPLLQPTGEMHNGKPLLANDVFRIVHDYFGHSKEGNGFGPNGEEMAYREHRKLYSPLAQKALASETRGQNSWVNFGPHGKHNRANPSKTVYADQKAGLLPKWAEEEY